MKVRCIKRRQGTDGRPLGFGLTVGREYEVLEVHFDLAQGVLLRLIGDDRFTPVLFSSDLFEIANQAIPRNWVIGRIVGKDGSSSYSLRPKPWLEAGFWEQYFDREPEAIAVFEEQRRLMNEP